MATPLIVVVMLLGWFPLSVLTGSKLIASEFELDELDDEPLTLPPLALESDPMLNMLVSESLEPWLKIELPPFATI